MKSAFLDLFLTVAFPAFRQRTLPALKDGTVLNEKAEYRHNGSLSIAGRVKLNTWDVYAGGETDLTFTNSVIDELSANGHARLTVRDSYIYADWLSLDGAQMQVDHSTVGAERLATRRRSDPAPVKTAPDFQSRI